MSLKLKLGTVERKELPVHFRMSEKVEEDSFVTDDINKQDPFRNPSQTQYLLERLGIDIKSPITLLNMLKKPDKCKFKNP